MEQHARQDDSFDDAVGLCNALQERSTSRVAPGPSMSVQPCACSAFVGAGGCGGPMAGSRMGMRRQNPWRGKAGGVQTVYADNPPCLSSA